MLLLISVITAETQSKPNWEFWFGGVSSPQTQPGFGTFYWGVPTPFSDKTQDIEECESQTGSFPPLPSCQQTEEAPWYHFLSTDKKKENY